MYKSSHPEVFCKKGVLRNFTKFTRKHLSLNVFFNKVAGLHPVAILKKTLWRSCFEEHVFIEQLRASAFKYNVAFKEIFSLTELKGTLLDNAFYCKPIFLCRNSISMFFEM